MLDGLDYLQFFHGVFLQLHPPFGHLHNNHNPRQSAAGAPSSSLGQYASQDSEAIQIHGESIQLFHLVLKQHTHLDES